MKYFRVVIQIEGDFESLLWNFVATSQIRISGYFLVTEL
ncbi:hypothetical protein VCR29J2_360299 [Vibrio coralliirubri]|nr:hypothetical protein VCR29J2_360299 [Vibrio coralliirubri]